MKNDPKFYDDQPTAEFIASMRAAYTSDDVPSVQASDVARLVAIVDGYRSFLDHVVTEPRSDRTPIGDLNFLDSMRSIMDDHEPDGWPAIQTKDVSRLVAIVDGLIPVLDRLEQWLARGARIVYQDNEWHIFKASGDGVVSGNTIRELLIELIFHEET